MLLFILPRARRRHRPFAIRGAKAGARGLGVLGLLAATPIPALAQTTPPPTVLHLSQTAERDVVRDRLRLELRAEATGGDPLVLQSAINRRMAAALGQARAVPGIEVETGSYMVTEEQPQNAPSRWRASQSLVLSGTAADAVLKLAEMLQSGGLLMSSIDYEVSPETVRAAEPELTAEALAGLGRRAAAIAARMHLSVLGYRDLRVGNAETGTSPMPRFAAMSMPPPSAQPGEAEIRVTVAAELLLGPHP